jgi:signal transduction histidine kinase
MMANQDNISQTQLQTLFEVSKKINSQLDLDKLLDEIMDLAVGLVQAEKGLILLREAQSENLSVKVARAKDKQATQEVVAMSKSTVDKVASSGQSMLIQAVSKDDKKQVPPSFFRHKLVSLVCVPLKIRDQIIGVIYLDTTKSKHFFQDEDLSFLEAFSNLAAIAIENAKNYEELQGLNANLENLVEERSQELQNKHGELKKAYQELQEAQVKLVRSEKMASLGMLVAGVAHEINTPLGSIHSNTDVFQRTINKLQHHLAESPDVSSDNFLTEFSKSIELMAKLSDVNKGASERIIQIVKGLRSFARLDEEEINTVDIHEGLDDTLDLIRHLQEDKIEIIKDYGDIPELRCKAGQLNQVLMSLLVNACQAISDKGQIHIRSFLDGDCICVQISDSGTGIPPENLEKIFDPGFTTKGVGVGTGLGLSIAYEIIEDHGGTIEVESKMGKGSTFTVKLPCSAFR